MNVLVTGGAGFIGSCFVRLALERHPDATIVNLDALTYAGNLESLAELEGNPRHVFVRGDIRDEPLVRELIARHAVQAVVNFAAESHVDRSIIAAEPFVDTNVVGTLRLLQAARAAGVRRFLHVSTDEVYGTMGPTGAATESSPLAPRSPYSASKAAAEHLVLAFHHTHGLPTLIARCANNYGPRQFPEKLIPLMTLNALEDQPLPVYGDGMHVRDWLHVEDCCDALDLLLHDGAAGEVYNVGGGCQRTNLEVIHAILALAGRSASLIRHVPDRPGHDRRYAMDSSKLARHTGWHPRHDFTEGLAATVAWYSSNRTWCERVRSGAYRDYYETQYGARLRAARES